MVIEYAQMMSTAHRILDGELYHDFTGKKTVKRWKHPNNSLEQMLYKATHVNHPCAIWVRETKANYEYMYEMWTELCRQFRSRHYKNHLTETKLLDLLALAPKNIKDSSMTEFVQCMPEKYKRDCAIKAYNLFYEFDKPFATYYSKYPYRYSEPTSS